MQDTSAYSTSAVELLTPKRALKQPISVYLHIPFCLSKCIYCDFNTYEGIETLMPNFVQALITETKLWSSRLGHPKVSTIFFGGGTPSYLPAHSIAEILDTVRLETDVLSDAEITLEANPYDVNLEEAEAWTAAGFNRISIGVQAFNDKILKSLSRRHDADAAQRAVETARDAGFENISIDLMFGLPNQTMAHWEETLSQAIALQTEHLSLYGLQIEPGTPLHRDVRIGAIVRPDDDLAADLYELAMDRLAIAGYEHYEISNWCKPGYRSQHNLAYWLNKPYLGLGPGAHSSLSGTRFANMNSPRRYIDTIKSAADNGVSPLSARPSLGDFAVDFTETTSRTMEISETLMLGMRLSDGISISQFNQQFDASLDDYFGDEIRELSASGLVERTDDRVRLTCKGRLLGNEVFERFIIIDDLDAKNQ